MNSISDHPARWLARLAALFAVTCLAACASPSGSLTLQDQGSMFIGGRTHQSDQLTAGDTGLRGSSNQGSITVDQMYVSYQVPAGTRRHVPVAMVHGCCLTTKSYEMTPDGRMGWNEYFLRRGRAVYLVEQASRARSGFDATVINKVKLGKLPPSALPNVAMASHEASWTLFRIGPVPGQAFAGSQFPVEAAQEFYKQEIPDFNALLPTPNPTLTNLSALAGKLGGVILMGHSQSGFYPQETALLNPAGIRGMVSLDTAGCSDTLKPEQIAVLARIPMLIVYGDNLEGVPLFAAFWKESFERCNRFVAQVNAVGGDAIMLSLPARGIRGNTHMLMMDRNNLQIADLILAWADGHVDSTRDRPRASR